MRKQMLERPAIAKTRLLILACTFIVSLPAIAGDLETNILSFPEIADWKYRPDLAITSANALISAGKENACAALEKVAEGNTGMNFSLRINQNVCLLCCLLFTSTNSNQSLRPPMIGAPLLSGYSFNSPGWLGFPFVIVSNMPLSMTSGYSLEGTPEAAQDYLAYCKVNGTFRTQLFSKPSSLAVSNALDQVFNTPTWESISWEAFGHITLTNLDWEQSSNIVENSVQDELRQQAANIGKN
jgi:hypothetical protein